VPAEPANGPHVAPVAPEQGEEGMADDRRDSIRERIQPEGRRGSEGNVPGEEDAGGDPGPDRREEERKDEHHWATGEVLGRLEKPRGTRLPSVPGRIKRRRRVEDVEGTRRVRGLRSSGRQRTDQERRGFNLGPRAEPVAGTVRRPGPSSAARPLPTFVGLTPPPK